MTAVALERGLFGPKLQMPLEGGDVSHAYNPDKDRDRLGKIAQNTLNAFHTAAANVQARIKYIKDHSGHIKYTVTESIKNAAPGVIAGGVARVVTAAGLGAVGVAAAPAALAAGAVYTGVNTYLSKRGQIDRNLSKFYHLNAGRHEAADLHRKKPQGRLATITDTIHRGLNWMSHHHEQQAVNKGFNAQKARQEARPVISAVQTTPEDTLTHYRRLVKNELGVTASEAQIDATLAKRLQHDMAKLYQAHLVDLNFRDKKDHQAARQAFNRLSTILRQLNNSLPEADRVSLHDGMLAQIREDRRALKNRLKTQTVADLVKIQLVKYVPRTLTGWFVLGPAFSRGLNWVRETFGFAPSPAPVSVVAARNAAREAIGADSMHTNTAPSSSSEGVPLHETTESRSPSIENIVSSRQARTILPQHSLIKNIEENMERVSSVGRRPPGLAAPIPTEEIVKIPIHEVELPLDGTEYADHADLFAAKRETASRLLSGVQAAVEQASSPIRPSELIIKPGGSVSQALLEAGVINSFDVSGSGKQALESVLDHFLANGRVNPAQALELRNAISANPTISFSQLYHEHNSAFDGLNRVNPGEHIPLKFPATRGPGLAAPLSQPGEVPLSNDPKPITPSPAPIGRPRIPIIGGDSTSQDATSTVVMAKNGKPNIPIIGGSDEPAPGVVQTRTSPTPALQSSINDTFKPRVDTQVASSPKPSVNVPIIGGDTPPAQASTGSITPREVVRNGSIPVIGASSERGSIPIIGDPGTGQPQLNSSVPPRVSSLNADFDLMEKRRATLWSAPSVTSNTPSSTKIPVIGGDDVLYSTQPVPRVNLQPAPVTAAVVENLTPIDVNRFQGLDFKNSRALPITITTKDSWLFGFNQYTFNAVNYSPDLTIPAPGEAAYFVNQSTGSKRGGVGFLWHAGRITQHVNFPLLGTQDALVEQVMEQGRGKIELRPNRPNWNSEILLSKQIKKILADWFAPGRVKPHMEFHQGNTAIPVEIQEIDFINRDEVLSGLPLGVRLEDLADGPDSVFVQFCGHSQVAVDEIVQQLKPLLPANDQNMNWALAIMNDENSNGKQVRDAVHIFASWLERNGNRSEVRQLAAPWIAKNFTQRPNISLYEAFRWAYDGYGKDPDTIVANFPAAFSYSRYIMRGKKGN